MREIKLRAWAKDARVMHPKWEKLDDENGQYILMQFTGLHDKNGKEIYEGDILKGNGDWSRPAIVEWEGGGFHGVGGYKHVGHNFFDMFEIIGNIYKDSHLMEGSETEAQILF